MTENQKLREAFEAYITDNGKWPNAILKAPGGQYLLLRTSVAWQDWKACAEALALPPSAPVGERAEFEKWAREHFYSGLACPSDTWSDERKTYNDPAHHMAFCAFRAALSAGDAVDAARYRWLADCLNYYEAIALISDGSLTAESLGKAIDAAMRKDKP